MRFNGPGTYFFKTRSYPPLGNSRRIRFKIGAIRFMARRALMSIDRGLRGKRLTDDFYANSLTRLKATWQKRCFSDASNISLLIDSISAANLFLGKPLADRPKRRILS